MSTHNLYFKQKYEKYQIFYLIFFVRGGGGGGGAGGEIFQYIWIGVFRNENCFYGRCHFEIFIRLYDVIKP